MEEIKKVTFTYENKDKCQGFDTIYSTYCKKGYQYHGARPTITKLFADIVFDEDKSVKWNREEVNNHNKKCVKEWEQYRLDCNAGWKRLEHDLKATIQVDYQWDDATVDKVYEYIYREHHSSIGDMIQIVPEICDFITEVFESFTKSIDIV